MEEQKIIFILDIIKYILKNKDNFVYSDDTLVHKLNGNICVRKSPLDVQNQLIINEYSNSFIGDEYARIKLFPINRTTKTIYSSNHSVLYVNDSPASLRYIRIGDEYFNYPLEKDDYFNKSLEKNIKYSYELLKMFDDLSEYLSEYNQIQINDLSNYELY